ncbi:hypothetical protein J2X01_002458 [Arthrobacter ginsengisoli]|uniref:Exo-alpha-sialidase n=1 Tax=Arthrobacter ginsengisoli TaxID=1356565 RepID=A0ABU1UDG2_9MICC|nr:hypothetical protein [Arthrobacter ginsengisoli]MDR7083165.1 hypothetical protein [Arthrobacter ginsengisoli]
MVYAQGRDGTVRKSSDGGATWVVRTSNFSSELGFRGCFLKLASGVLLTVRNNDPLDIFRSLDDGATWANTGFTFRNLAIMLTSQSWCQDPTSGYVYFGEYHTNDSSFSVVNVYRSVDDGISFQLFYSFPGPSSSSPQSIRHIHGVQYDAISGRVYVMVGDEDSAAGIYRITADGGGLEVVLDRRMLAAQGLSNWGSVINIMWFPNYIAWGEDQAGGSYLMRMARSEIGKSIPKVEAIYRLSSGGWGTVKASLDGTTWLLCGSAEQEGAPLDRAMHLYAVTDEGATVWEVGTIPAAGQPYSAPVAIGQAELHDDVLWFGTRGLDQNGARDRQFKAQMSRGAAPIPPPDTAPMTYGWETISGRGAYGAAGSYVLGYTKAPLRGRQLFIFGAGVRSLSGKSRLRVIRKDTLAVIMTTTLVNVRGGTDRRESSEYLLSTVLPADTEVEISIQDSSGTTPGEATAYVTFGWGM